MSSPLHEMANCVKLIHATSHDLADAPVQVLLQLFKDMSQIIGKLGVVFSMATADIETKRETIHKIINEAHIEQCNVQELIVYENGQQTSATGATRKLLPLIRSLELVAQLLHRIHTDNTELGECIRNAYWETIYQYHTYLVAQGVAASTYLAPYKKDFFVSLGLTEEEAKPICVELAPMLTRLHAGLKSLYIREKVWDLK